MSLEWLESGHSDFRQAFDSVLHDILFVKINRDVVQETVLGLIQFSVMKNNGKPDNPQNELVRYLTQLYTGRKGTECTAI